MLATGDRSVSAWLGIALRRGGGRLGEEVGEDLAEGVARALGLRARDFGDGGLDLAEHREAAADLGRRWVDLGGRDLRRGERADAGEEVEERVFGNGRWGADGVELGVAVAGEVDRVDAAAGGARGAG